MVNMQIRKEILVKAIGRALKKARENKGMSIEEVATGVNITKEELVEIENGNLGDVTEDDLNLFLDICKKNKYIIR